jgi:predicted dehydrogenase
MLRIGLIGFGMAGQVFHAPTIRAVSGIELACILERSGELARQKYPDVPAVRTLEELLADNSIQVCVVATPNVSHFELARRCLLAGRDVVVDKPFTVTSQEAQQLIDLARQRKRLLTVFQSRRWDGDFRTVRKIVEAGELGKIVEYECRYDRFRPNPKPGWRERPAPGSGVLFDLGAHLIDQALVLFGAPQAVTAELLRQRESSEVDDAFDVFLEYPGLRVALRARILAYAPGPHFTVHGTQGSFLKYGMDPQEEILKKGEPVPWGAHWGEDSQEFWGTLSRVGEAPQRVKTEAGDYRGFYQNLRDGIVEGKPLAVQPDTALQVIRIIELARRASEQHCRVALR